MKSSIYFILSISLVGSSAYSQEKLSKMVENVVLVDKIFYPKAEVDGSGSHGDDSSQADRTMTPWHSEGLTLSEMAALYPGSVLTFTDGDGSVAKVLNYEFLLSTPEARAQLLADILSGSYDYNKTVSNPTITALQAGSNQLISLLSALEEPEKSNYSKSLTVALFEASESSTIALQESDPLASTVFWRRSVGPFGEPGLFPVLDLTGTGITRERYMNGVPPGTLYQTQADSCFVWDN